MIELAAIVWTVLNVTVFPDGPAPYQGDADVVKDIYWRACVEQEIEGNSYRACETGGTQPMSIPTLTHFSILCLILQP